MRVRNLPITSLQNQKIADLLKLDRKKDRDASGLFVVEGPHLVKEAIDAGLCQTVFAIVDPKYPGVETILVSDAVMNKIAATFTPQGILAIVRRPGIRPAGDRILLLDQVQDPGNMGTLLRSALAFGFDSVVADGCVDIYNQKTLRATQGAIFRLNLSDLPIPSFLSQNADVTVYGTDPHGGVSLDECKPAQGRIAVLLGNEGAGIRPTLLATTIQNIRIETAEVESLNVAIAGAIVMHRLRAKN